MTEQSAKVDPQVVAGLKLAEAATENKPVKFVLVYKGTLGTIIIGRLIPPEKVKAATKSLPGAIISRGVCYKSPGSITFLVTIKPKGNFVAAAKAILHAGTGKTITPKLIVQPTAKIEVDDNESDEAEGQRQDQFGDEDQLGDVEPTNEQMQGEAETSQSHPETASTATTSEIEQHGDTRATPQQQWQSLLDQLTPRIRQAIDLGGPKSLDLKKAFIGAIELAKRNQFAKAAEVLRVAGPIATKMLQAAADENGAEATARPTPTPKRGEKMLRDWQTTVKQTGGEVIKLIGVLRQTKIKALIEVGDEILAGLRGYTKPMSDLLAEYAKAEDQPELKAKVKALMESYRQKILEDKTLAAASENPFNIEVSASTTIASQLDKMLGELAA